MLVAGIISGIAVGNIMITNPRLAAFGLLMAFVYGRMIRDAREARADNLIHTEDEAPAEELESNIIPLPGPDLMPAHHRSGDVP